MTIDKLTPEQEAKIPEYLELGRKYGLGTDQYDSYEAEEVRRLYT